MLGFVPVVWDLFQVEQDMNFYNRLLYRIDKALVDVESPGLEFHG